MAVLFIGNAYDASGNVIYDPNIPNTVRVTYESNVVNPPKEIPIGVPTDVTYASGNLNIWLRFISLNPDDLIVDIKQGFKGTYKTIKDSATAPIASVATRPSATELGQTPLTSATDRRTYIVQTQSMLVPPEPETERLRSFLIGNNFISGIGVVQTGDVQVTATLNVTIGGVVTPHSIPLGVSTDVDILNATKVEWVVTPLADIELCIARAGYASTIQLLPIVDNSLTFEVPLSRVDTANNIDRVLEVRSRIKTKARFNVGNVLDNGVATVKNGSKFTGTIRLVLSPDYSKPSFSKDTFESTTFDYGVVSGWSEEIDMHPFNSGKILITPDPDNVITDVIFPSEVEFSANTIDYVMTADEINPLNLLPRNYVVAVNGDSTDPDDDIPPVPVDTNPINNNYLITRSELKNFEQAVNAIQTNEISFENVYWVSIMSYISSIRVLPFTLDAGNLGAISPIKVRNESLSTGVELSGDSITTDLGVINIPKVHDNSLDYAGVSVELLIPFVASAIRLDAELSVGYNLAINMVTNISSGSTTVNVMNVELQRLISTSIVSIGTDYPFFSQTVVKQIEFNSSQAVNGINRAYVKITRPDYNNTRPMAQKIGTIGNQTGYIEFDEVNINSLALADEMDLIETLLKNGVLVK